LGVQKAQTLNNEEGGYIPEKNPEKNYCISEIKIQKQK